MELEYIEYCDLPLFHHHTRSLSPSREFHHGDRFKIVRSVHQISLYISNRANIIASYQCRFYRTNKKYVSSAGIMHMLSWVVCVCVCVSAAKSNLFGTNSKLLETETNKTQVVRWVITNGQRNGHICRRDILARSVYVNEHWCHAMSYTVYTYTSARASTAHMSRRLHKNQHVY